MNEKNKRIFFRNPLKPLKIEAIYQDANGKYLRGTVRNISISGIYIETPYTREDGEIMHISLVGSSLEKIIGVEGKVTRCEPGKGMGIEFTDQDNREIKQLIRSMKRQGDTSLLAVNESFVETE